MVLRGDLLICCEWSKNWTHQTFEVKVGCLHDQKVFLMERCALGFVLVATKPFLFNQLLLWPKYIFTPSDVLVHYVLYVCNSR